MFNCDIEDTAHCNCEGDSPERSEKATFYSARRISSQEEAEGSTCYKNQFPRSPGESLTTIPSDHRSQPCVRRTPRIISRAPVRCFMSPQVLLCKFGDMCSICSPTMVRRLNSGGCFNNPIRSRQIGWAPIQLQASREADAQSTSPSRSPSLTNQKALLTRIVSKADFATQGKLLKAEIRAAPVSNM